MELPQKGRGLGLLLTATASIIWGSIFVASGIGLQYTTPYDLVFLRFATASAFVAVLSIPFRRNLKLASELVNRSTWVLGGIYALGFLFQYLGQDLTNASLATLLSNLAPILVPILAFTIWKEQFTTTQKAASILGLSGLLLITMPDFNLHSVTTGDLLLFGSSLSYTLFIILSKQMKKETVGSSFAVILSMTVFLAPQALLLGDLASLNLTANPIVWTSIFYMGVPGSVLALAFYLRGLASITASESASLLLLNIPIGLILATLILGELLTLPEMAGGLSISAAILLISVEKRSTPTLARDNHDA